MNILITSGSTIDFIDSVHYVTNISDGSLAANIGEELSKQLDVERIFYVCGKKTKYPWQHSSSNDQKFFLDEWLDKIAIYPVDDVNDLEKEVTDIFTEFNVDVVIHLMSIVNYGNSRVHLLNNKKDAASFIEHIAQHFDVAITVNEDVSAITPSNPDENRILSGFDRLFIEQLPTKKILKLFREFKEDVTIVSSKTAANGSHDQLITDAQKSLENNNSDLVVAIDLDECKRESDAVIYAVSPTNSEPKRLQTNEKIADFLIEFINK